MTLSSTQIEGLTGGYIRAKGQLAELRRQAFVRARIGRKGKILLERARYEAVCSGQYGLAGKLVDGRILAGSLAFDISIEGNRARSAPIYKGMP